MAMIFHDFPWFFMIFHDFPWFPMFLIISDLISSIFHICLNGSASSVGAHLFEHCLTLGFPQNRDLGIFTKSRAKSCPYAQCSCSGTIQCSGARLAEPYGGPHRRQNSDLRWCQHGRMRSQALAQRSWRPISHVERDICNERVVCVCLKCRLFSTLIICLDWCWVFR